jgi:hypothetical protein
VECLVPGLSAHGLTWCAADLRYGLAPDPLEIAPREVATVCATDPGDATARWAEAQLRYEQLHDDDGQARCLLHRATLLAAADPDRARGLLLDSVELRRDRPGIGTALAHARLADLAADEPTRARHRDLARAALAPWHDRLEQPAEVAALADRLKDDHRT